MTQNQLGNESSATVRRWPPCRSYDVIMYDVTLDHGNVWVNNSSHSRVRDVPEVSLCLSCQDASTDIFLVKMHWLMCDFSRQIVWYATWLIWVIYLVKSFDLTWGKIYKLTFHGQFKNLHMSRCLLIREIWRCLSLYSIFLNSKKKSEALILLTGDIFLAWPGKVKCDLQ